jgi:hypothetical protein
MNDRRFCLAYLAICLASLLSWLIQIFWGR